MDNFPINIILLFKRRHVDIFFDCFDLQDDIEIYPSYTYLVLIYRFILLLDSITSHIPSYQRNADLPNNFVDLDE